MKQRGFTRPAKLARRRRGAGFLGGAVNEARDHGVELVAPVVSPGEVGEVALGMIRAELAEALDRDQLDLARAPRPRLPPR